MEVTKKELKKMYYDMVAVRYENPPCQDWATNRV
jgi:hypothetical protein